VRRRPGYPAAQVMVRPSVVSQLEVVGQRLQNAGAAARMSNDEVIVGRCSCRGSLIQPVQQFAGAAFDRLVEFGGVEGMNASTLIRLEGRCIYLPAPDRRSGWKCPPGNQSR
jgi:hypothetical protein